MQSKPNPKLFYELSDPFPDIDSLHQALTDFELALSTIRTEHRIAELCCTVRVGHIGEDGQPIYSLQMLSYGDSERLESMAAYQFGGIRKQRQQHIANLMKMGEADAEGE